MNETTFTAKAIVTEGDEGLWNIALGRLEEDKLLPLINIANVTGSAVYAKTGIIVPNTTVPLGDGVEAAKSILQKGFDSLGQRSLITKDEVVDMLLDLSNTLNKIETEEAP